MRGEQRKSGAPSPGDEGSRHPRVCFISSHAQLGGSELVLETLLDGLPSNSVDSVLLLQDGPVLTRLRRWDPTVIPTGNRLLDLVRSAAKVRSHLKETRPHVVHANGVKAALVTVLARPQVPILWMKHDFSFDGRVGRWLGGRVTCVVGVSRAVLAELGPKVRKEVVYPAKAAKSVDRSAARNDLVKRLGVDPSTRLVGLLGRLHPSKGQQEMVSVLPKLLESTAAVHLVFAGGADPSVPEHKDETTATIERMGAAASVTFLGHVDDPEALVAGLDLLVIPSVRVGKFGREGFGLTAVEAMAHGTPVVAYDSGALGEVLGNCGVLVPEGDREKLAQVIERVLDDPALQARLIECGANRVTQHFSADRMLEQMEKQYQECAREG